MDNDGDIFEDDLEILDIIDFGFPRQIYNRANHFVNLDELSFFRRFRLTKNTTLALLELIEEDLEFPNDINQSVSPMNQLLTCLRYYATDGHLMAIADFTGMHTSTVSRIILRVSRAIASLGQRFIKMPEPDEQLQQTAQDFFVTARFPRVIGALDGTHVKIISPGGEDGEIFRNRKSYFSINVQAVCNAHLQILDVVARWPGSAHDATIFANSRLRARFENGNFRNYILLGDSGYPLKPYLFTPLHNPLTRGQQLYNAAHIRTRNCVERLFGTWKRRFPVLAYGVRLKLDTALVVIVATAVLHNMAIDMNEEEPPPPEAIDPDELERFIALGQIQDIPFLVDHPNPVNLRNELVHNYFAN
jgi:hypothetical protein